jgi:hypothetical protein
LIALYSILLPSSRFEYSKQSYLNQDIQEAGGDLSEQLDRILEGKTGLPDESLPKGQIKLTSL